MIPHSLRHRLACALACLLASACFEVLPPLECVDASDCASSEFCVSGTCTQLATELVCPPAPDAAVFGDPCGTCGNGVWACNAERWHCVGAWESPCGGCTESSDFPGSACGMCGGEWRCDGEILVCSSEPNACGGCGPLEPVAAIPGDTCEFEEPDGIPDGIWTCSDQSTVTCTSPGLNACGGSATLSAIPGTACGACDDRVWRCDGAEAVACCAIDDSECGPGGEVDPNTQCNATVGREGLPCGICGGGVWQLTERGGEWRCVGGGQNRCGGCSDLANVPGTDCSPGAVWACAGPDAVVCVAMLETACSQQPEGAPCGPCGRGTAVCAGPSSEVCVGDVDRNQCGTCGALSLDPGDWCGEARWTCTESEDEPLVCAPSELLDACGGDSGSTATLLSECGECGGKWGCDDQGLVCVIPPAQRPRPMFRDFDRDGFGDEQDPGQSLCGDAERYAPNAEDCDDELEAVNPGRTEVPGNGRDDDCNPNTRD